MKTVIRGPSIVERTRRVYAFNQAYIQKIVNLTDLDYYEREFETGCKFLESNFPEVEFPNITYQHHAYSRQFWNWFRLEWKKWEHEFTAYHSSDPFEVSKYEWKVEMEGMIWDWNVQASFHHSYLKHLKKERGKCQKKEKGEEHTDSS